MKKFLLIPLIVITAIQFSAAQLATPNYAKYYYKITVQDGSNYVMDQSTSTGNVVSHPYHGGKNQQWTVLPHYITAKDNVLRTSGEFVMASRVNGKVVDIKDGSNVQCYSPFHAGTNQVFTLYRRIGEVYAIKSPQNSQRVFDRSNNNNNISFYGPHHDGGNQRFLFSTSNAFPGNFSSLRTKRLLAIPFPAAPSSFTQTMPTETSKVFIQETLIPFAFIQNDLPVSIQVENTPYYKLVHSQFYRAAAGNWDITYLPGIEITHSISVRNGITSSKVTELSQKLNLSFSSTGEIAATIKIISLKASQTIGAAFERNTKTVSSLTETYEKIESYSKKISVPVDRRIVTYQLTDYYELYRTGESTPFLAWEVGRDQIAEVNYEGNSSGGRVRELPVATYTLADGKMIPNTTEETESVESSLTEVSDLDLYPNPSNGTYLIKNSKKVYPSITIKVYDRFGKMVHEENRSNSSLNDSWLDLNNLPLGPYVVKISAGKELLGTKRILKE